jgi:hypothetical protein
MGGLPGVTVFVTFGTHNHSDNNLDSVFLSYGKLVSYE